MTQAYFLVPGLLLDKDAKGALSPETLALAGKLSENLASAPLVQELSTGVFSRAVHLPWLWTVLMRRSEPICTTPYAWPVQQGPQLCSNDVYELHIAHMDADGVIHEVSLNDETVESISSVLTAKLLSSGFVLQRWDKILYLTRKNAWGYARPFKTIVGRKVDLAHDIEGWSSDPEQNEMQRTDAQKALNELQSALQDARLECQGVSLNALWIDGGGRYENEYPPTTIRSVLSDDACVIGWGLAAGILNHRLGPVTNAVDWPTDAPSGERIAVIDSLYEAWLAHDWTSWQKALPSVVEQIRVLSEAARKKGCEQALIVACGDGLTVSIPKKLTHPKSLLARFSRHKKLDASAWLFADIKDLAGTEE